MITFMVITTVLCINNTIHKRNEDYQPMITQDFPHLLGEERLKAWMDDLVNPCDDFYQYSCGGFLKRYSDFPNTDVMKIMGRANALLMKNILIQKHDALAKTAAESDIFFKTREYYLSCENKNIIEQRGFEPIRSIANSIIRHIDSDNSLPAIFGELQGLGVDVFFRSKYSKVETMDPDDLRLQFFPSPGYDVSRDTVKNTLLMFQKNKVIDRYVNIQNISSSVWEIEQGFVSLVRLLNKLRHKSGFDKPNQFQTIENFNKYTEMDWNNLVSRIKLGKITKIHLWSGLKPWINWFKKFGQLNRQEIKYYLLWRLATSHFNKLSKEYRNHWETYIYRVATKPDFPEIDSDGDIFLKDCVEETGKNLRYLSGHLFVKYAFNETQREHASIMINSLFDAFRDRLKELTWMDDYTKEKSMEKLDRIVKVIGYPDWLSNPQTVANHYRPLKLKPDHYFENAVQAQVFTELIPAVEQSRHSSLDRANIYFGFPWQLNAFHLTDLVLIQINSGILQRPIYSVLNPIAMNYGSVGTVIAHEITHGFDSIGALLDSRGVRRHWMTEKSHHRFYLKGKCFIKQYNNIKVKLPDGSIVHPNGKKSLPENMADNGGMHTSFRAMKNLVGEENLHKKNGTFFTPAQQFFLGMAQTWCSIRSPALVKYMIKVDVHSPNQARVHGMVMNSPEFAKAFHCSVGSQMRPKPAEEICRAY